MQDAGTHYIPADRRPGATSLGGRPREALKLAELAREHTEEALLKIVTLMRDPKAARRTQLAAACELLDRGYGRAPQALSVAATLEAGDTWSAVFHRPWSQLTSDQQALETARRLAFILAGGAHAQKSLEANGQLVDILHTVGDADDRL